MAMSPGHRRRRRIRIALSGGLVAAGLLSIVVSAQVEVPRPSPVVVSADIEGIIHPVAAQHVQRVIAQADQRGASLVVFSLRTPGGLVDSTRDINNAIIASRVPVAVFVGPSGNRAASAGFLITIAADIAAMAPGTHIGAAHPVAGGGDQQVDETMAKKMASDVASYARTLAAQRKRNVELVEQGVIESRSFTEHEALEAAPPLIDLIANDIPDLLAKLDGREVTRFDGRTETLRTSSATVQHLEMTRSHRVLSALAHPQIAYLLLTLGMLGLTVEFWNPGAIFPGVAGGICLLLAFFAFQVLPINYVGLALIVFGLLLLVLELVVTSFGMLAAGGIVSLVLGSMMLVDTPLPEMQLGLRFILPVSLATAGIMLFLVRLGIQAQRRPSVTGESGMLGTIGEALSPIVPGGRGRVRAHGEIWAATSSEAITEGDTVRVTAVDGLTLTVVPVGQRPAWPPDSGGSARPTDR
jgi:membrane-bound serine protease (ClpP class)